MLGLTLLALGVTLPHAACAAPADSAIVEAREALRKKDRTRLAAARSAAMAAQHPLAMWADYFELGNRLAEAQQAELNAFYARWPATYVEDRLRERHEHRRDEHCGRAEEHARRGAQLRRFLPGERADAGERHAGHASSVRER